jgi:hypothetical protein
MYQEADMRHLILFVLLVGLPAAAAAQASSSTLTGLSNTMNPAISVNGLFWAQISRDDPAPEHNRVALQEAEAQLTSIVDPFWKANVTAAVHPAHSHTHAAEDPAGKQEHETEEEHSRFELDIEEAYIDARSLPARLGLRLGKFYLPLGKHVPLHTHQFPFAQAPLGVSSFLGEHSLTEIGALLTVSLPLPWYSDLKIYGVNGDAAVFDSENRDLAYGGRWTNLWDVGQASTLELSGSLLSGPDGSQPGTFRRLDVFGLDCTYKWICAQRSRGPALTVQGELLLPRPEGGLGDPYGWYALLQYRFRRQWWLGAMVGQAHGDAAGHSPEDAHAALGRHLSAEQPALVAQELDAGFFSGRIKEYKFNVTLVPSEFSALRAEVAYFDDTGTDGQDDLRLLLQWNFTLGSHPAHLY